MAIHRPIGRSAARFRAPQGIKQLDAADTRLLARAAEAGRICAYLRTAIGKGTSSLTGLRDVKRIRPSPEPWRQGSLSWGFRAELKVARQCDPFDADADDHVWIAGKWGVSRSELRSSFDES